MAVIGGVGDGSCLMLDPVCRRARYAGLRIVGMIPWSEGDLS